VISPQPDSKSKPERILLVRISAMGDVIHAIPAFAALRAAFPEASIGWAIEERWRPLLPAGVDMVHTVRTKAWRKQPFAASTWREIRDSRRQIKAAAYDLAVDVQGAIRSGVISWWSNAPQRVGFAKPRESQSTMFYTNKISATRRHVIEQNLELVASITGEPYLVYRSAEIPVSSAARTFLRRLEGDGFLRTGGYAILNPGAGWGAKCWPTERYASVAKALRENGVPSLVNYGPGEEDMALAVEQQSHGAARKITCTLEELVGVTKHARLFIGGDTGPMHLAAHFGVPVVALFGPTDPGRNGPYGTRSMVLRNTESKTSYSHTSDAHQGLMGVSIDEVVSAAQKLLESETIPAGGAG
jgi:lipopolysaccharide heptosyltransferase I